ncbi:uncharacterized protein E0L32_004231 [Thyridium curvatum]|uniref:Sas10 C-terminal domain-containing protein n=1 Tax=Thyridium curvatum TaxID=1093900 RepID=A0A507B765_9PEZI|nr:uncharacterized protein E0L32_004231 [Thyridium curvatum]TPX15533.1 hypothetical protein E0L32_004231 [Thyridium curvatum]
MGKKRKASRQAAEPTGPRELDPKDARLGPVTTYEDLADSEEEYFINKDKIMLEDGPRSKRQRKENREDEFLEPSDEEVLGYDDDDSEDEDDRPAPKPQKGRKAAQLSEDEEAQDGEEEGDQGWWGSSKQEYYNADTAETEGDALEEEAEARRLQQKKLAKMSEADFIFDEDEWLAPEKEAADDDEVVTEVLKDVEISEDMSAEDRYKLLQARYPEFDYLVQELKELQPLLLVCQKEAEGKPSKSLEVVKYWVLGCYVAALASYFAILTSPSRDGSDAQKALSPTELRDHEVMETLVSCREAWLKVKKAKPVKDSEDASSGVSSDEDMVDQSEAPIEPIKVAKTKEEIAASRKRKAAEKAKKAKAKEIEASLADLSDLLAKPRKSSKAKTAKVDRTDEQDDYSDFGEEDIIDARTAADKAERKKSLRFYTSQIVQKANRRAGAGRDAGGDMDIPHRERLRDRQARLNAEAEKRGKKNSKLGSDLDDLSDDEAAGARDAPGDEEYYDLVASASRKKKEEKASRAAALAAASAADRIVEQEEVGADGKRKITYTIEKNKSLAGPRRKKEVANPRVKKRKQYEKKTKKLKSQKAVYSGGEGRGGYGGELTGIKTGLIKSIKL